MSISYLSKENSLKDDAENLDKFSEYPEYEAFIKYVSKILTYKYRIVTIALIASCFVFIFSKFVNSRYTATATLAINISEGPGGVSPNKYRGSDTISVLEYDFVVDASQANEKERITARMFSYAYISEFITSENLLPWLFHNDWDSDKQQWKKDFNPDMREAVLIFKKEKLGINTDRITELLNISITADTPDMASHLANMFAGNFNTFIKNINLQEMRTRREYLESRLIEVNNAEAQRSIYRLLEAQLSVESLLHARRNYPLEIIQVATDPLTKSYPNRKLWIIATFFGTILISILILIFKGIVTSLGKDIRRFEKKNMNHDEKTLNENNQNLWVE